jgi:hypothetical protein
MSISTTSGRVSRTKEMASSRRRPRRRRRCRPRSRAAVEVAPRRRLVRLGPGRSLWKTFATLLCRARRTSRAMHAGFRSNARLSARPAPILGCMPAAISAPQLAGMLRRPGGRRVVKKGEPPGGAAVPGVEGARHRLAGVLARQRLEHRRAQPRQPKRAAARALGPRASCPGAATPRRPGLRSCLSVPRGEVGRAS